MRIEILITDLGVVVQVLSVPCDFHTGIYLCFPLILGNLKYITNTQKRINNTRTCNDLSHFLQNNYDWSKPGDVGGAWRLQPNLLAPIINQVTYKHPPPPPPPSSAPASPSLRPSSAHRDPPQMGKTKRVA